jgi:hypothetical protein
MIVPASLQLAFGQNMQKIVSAIHTMFQKLFILSIYMEQGMVMHLTENHKKRLLLEDNPIAAEEKDAFRNSIFVDVLFDLIANIDEPCNIGLFGKWGTGKTSIVNMLFKRIRNDETLSQTTECLYFDAWKYADDSLRAHLLIELDKKFGNPFGRKKIIDILYGMTEEEIKDESKKALEKIYNFISDYKVLLISSFIIAAVGLILLLPNFGIATVVATASVPLVAELISKMNSVNKSMKKRRILPGKEWPGEFETIFKEIVSRGEAYRIVIAIDNLDRCQSHVVMQTLALLKTFMSIPNCIYIVPCDDEALLNHITTIDRRREYLTDSGQEFLRKVFQVKIKIPPFLKESLEDYAQNLRSQMRIQFDENVQDVIVSAHVKNPRRIIHAFNQLTTLYLLAKKKEEKGLIKKGVITDNLPFLAKISIIREEWGELLDDLSCNNYLLEDIETFFRGMPLEKGTYVKIDEHFDKNPELRDFLNATRAVQVKDVEPFLLLNQEVYESAIPELDRLRDYIRENDVNQVRDILRGLCDAEKSDYVKEILKICRKAVNNGRYTVGFNCLNILSHVYGVLPGELCSEVAREFGSYLDREGIREFSSLLKCENLFEILPYMHGTNRDNILCYLVGCLFTKGSINDVLLLRIVERSDLVGSETVKRLNDLLIGILNSEKPETAMNIIKVILQQETACKKLIEPRLFSELMNRVTDESKRKKVDESPASNEKKKKTPKVHIRVMTLFEGETVVHISTNANVKKLVEKAATQLGVDPQERAIMSNGNVVPSGVTLSKAGITHAFPVLLIPKPWNRSPSE